MAAASRTRALWRSERPFLVLLALALVVRVVVQVAYTPGFVFSDGPTYLALVDDLTPSPDRPVGYGGLLVALSWLTRSIVAITLTQHVLGLLTAIALYVLLRRWGVTAGLAALATVPLLLDEMQLVLEHSVLSDVLFDALVVVGVVALAWWRQPRPVTTAVAGVLLGLATLVRVVGEPTVLAAGLFCLLAATTWRSRVLHVAIVVVAFLAPVTAYAAWFHHDNGAWAITQASGRALYMRTTGFVDCTRFSMPAYERTLCPTEPLGQRQDPTYYGWHDLQAVKGLRPPAGVSADQALRDFAGRAIRAQPLDYAEIVGRDLAMTFAPSRVDMFEYNTAHKWTFEGRFDYQPTSTWTKPAYAAHGGDQPGTRQPFADVLAAVGRVMYLPGPVALLLVVVAVVGLVGRRREGAPETRPLGILLLVLALGLILVPDLTAEFTWRYQLPLVVLAPAAAALGWTRRRSRSPDQPGTSATPSTDWPNGGVTRRSTNLVTGTTKRS